MSVKVWFHSWFYKFVYGNNISNHSSSNNTHLPSTIGELNAWSKATSKYYFRDFNYADEFGRVYHFYPTINISPPLNGLTKETYDKKRKSICNKIDEKLKNMSYEEARKEKECYVELHDLDREFRGGEDIKWDDTNCLKFPKSTRDINDIIEFCNKHDIDKNNVEVSRWYADESGWPNEIVEFNLGTGEEIQSSSGNGVYNKNRNLYKK